MHCLCHTERKIIAYLTRASQSEVSIKMCSCTVIICTMNNLSLYRKIIPNQTEPETVISIETSSCMVKFTHVYWTVYHCQRKMKTYLTARQMSPLKCAPVLVYTHCHTQGKKDSLPYQTEPDKHLHWNVLLYSCLHMHTELQASPLDSSLHLSPLKWRKEIYHRWNMFCLQTGLKLL